jgi:hypothetical protein
MKADRYSVMVAALFLGLASFVLPALGDEIRRIHFAPGHFSAAVENAVVRGDRDVYRVRVGAGQIMSVSVQALERNAAIAVYGPGAEPAIAGTTEDITSWKGRTPSSGDYTIVVGGTRGNAQYVLTVEIH